MFASLNDLPAGTLAGLRARVTSLDSGVLELTLVRPVSNPLEPDQEVGTLQIDLTSGDVTGDIPNVDAELVEVVALAVSPGDIVQEQTTGLIAVVTGVSPDKTRLSVPGMTISTSNIRKVGHVDLETLEDLS